MPINFNYSVDPNLAAQLTYAGSAGMAQSIGQGLAAFGSGIGDYAKGRDEATTLRTMLSQLGSYGNGGGGGPSSTLQDHMDVEQQALQDKQTSESKATTAMRTLGEHQFGLSKERLNTMNKAELLGTLKAQMFRAQMEDQSTKRMQAQAEATYALAHAHSLNAQEAQRKEATANDERFVPFMSKLADLSGDKPITARALNIALRDSGYRPNAGSEALFKAFKSLNPASNLFGDGTIPGGFKPSVVHIDKEGNQTIDLKPITPELKAMPWLYDKNDTVFWKGIADLHAQGGKEDLIAEAVKARSAIEHVKPEDLVTKILAGITARAEAAKEALNKSQFKTVEEAVAAGKQAGDTIQLWDPASGTYAPAKLKQ